MKKCSLFLLTTFLLFGTLGQTRAEKLNVLVWNIKKSSSLKWMKDFHTLSKNIHYAMIQEGVDALNTLKAFKQNFRHQRFYESWSRKSEATGLINASRSKPHYIKKYISEDKEPIFKTPKLISVEKTFLTNRKELMIANIHALNFRSITAYKKQLESIEPSLRSHDGPIIFAGDFNTWSRERKEFTDKLCKRLGLVEVAIERRENFLYLDHVYTRGFKKMKAFQIDDKSSSDHYPIRVELEY